MSCCLDTDEIWIVLSYGAISFGDVLNARGSVSIRTPWCFLYCLTPAYFEIRSTHFVIQHQLLNLCTESAGGFVYMVKGLKIFGILYTLDFMYNAVEAHVIIGPSAPWLDLETRRVEFVVCIGRVWALISTSFFSTSLSVVLSFRFG